MKPLPPTPAVDSYDRTVTASSLVVSYLLVAAIPAALWAVSEPASAAVVAAIAVAAGAASRSVRRLRRDSRRRRRLCLPHTPVCVEL
ncbi:hypothetical protein SAMN04488063_1951 [Halopelagius inordinatus]|uniref:Uncharacterized protein n=1 Tax=Halopelagius inordinatus TaxID=553467 RepID=A0A1I2RN91_9EURY|nr:hypothetical protein [Halopelagius inordinatus]SFG40939.1 hypothetical protein SAMN04488063_1951 [Halopelagius inordinatus]